MILIISLYEQLSALVAGDSARGPIIIAVLLLVVVAFTWGSKVARKPRSLRDPVPFVFNTVQFLTNNAKFTKRVT